MSQPKKPVVKPTVRSRQVVERVKSGVAVKTKIKAGGYQRQHNQRVTSRPSSVTPKSSGAKQPVQPKRPGVRVKTKVKSGGSFTQHNQRCVCG